MTATAILSPLKFCKKCQCETARYKGDRCKPCSDSKAARWLAKQPKKVKENREFLDAAKKERDKKNKAAWAAANPEKVKAASKAWIAKNQERHSANVNRWQSANPDRVKAAIKKWRSENPETYRIIGQNRRARKSIGGGKLSQGLAAKLFKMQRGKCSCCGLPLGKEYHLDHIMPLALGGSNTDENIQLLRKRCNLQKNKKHPVDFMQSRGFLL